jgi:protein phosphatase 1 regulatory subunit 10
MNPGTLLTSINPTSFYGSQSSTTQQPQSDSQTPQQSSTLQNQAQPIPQAQPPPIEPSPEEIAQRKARFYTSIKPLLQSSAFSGAQAVNTLVERIMSNIHEADPSIRLEILTKIRDGAGNHYFRAWSENTRAMDITREWLKAAYSANDDSPLIETIMPLLHVRGRSYSL